MATKNRITQVPDWLWAPLILSALSVGLYVGRVLATDRMHFGFMVWNLFLAWLPLLFAWQLGRELSRWSWKTWRPLLFTTLWLLFLPNSFYMVTDFIHVSPDEDISMLYDIAVIFSFALTGILLGCMSIYSVHTKLRNRLGRRNILVLLGGAVLLSGFAIYLGRHLDYNSWDVLLNPGGILLDVIFRLSDPFEHGTMYTTTLLFFVFISMLYASFYAGIRALKRRK